MASRGQVRWKVIKKMLDACAKGWTHEDAVRRNGVADLLAA